MSGLFLLWIFMTLSAVGWLIRVLGSVIRIADALEELVRLQHAAARPEPAKAEAIEKPPIPSPSPTPERARTGFIGDLSRVGMLKKSS